MKPPVALFLMLVASASFAGAAEKPIVQQKPIPQQLRTAEQRFGNAARVDEPSFRRHVIPMFSRLGCSGRECHGSFQGRGGFQLSLFGYDFDHDHKEITADEEDGIRIDAKDPKQSLILLKPTMQEKHKGKERFKVGSWEYNVVLKWIANGAKNDTKETGEFDRLEVYPREVVFKKPGEFAQLRVLAYWRDGTVEDVTQLTRFRTNDESVAEVSDTGLITCKDKGDTHVVAFYDNGVTPIPVMLPVSEYIGPKFPKLAVRTRVDDLVVSKLRKVGIVPSAVCTDTEFLRRVSLDVAGTLPTPEEITAFLANPAPNKRARKIEELLNSPAYAAWWTTKFCDFTGNNPRTLNVNNGVRNLSGALSRQWYDWIYTRVAANQPYDKLAAGIILASSRSRPDQTYEEYALEMSSYFRKEKPADFTRRETMPYFWIRNNLRKAEEKALAFSHTFLGVRIECAQCHKHPFDQWTKTDFAQFQAFFEPISYGGRNDPGDGLTFQKISKEIRDAAVANNDPKNTQKAQQAEVARRVDAGEVAPWQELYIQREKMTSRKSQSEKGKKDDFSGRVITPKVLGGDSVLLTEYDDPREPLMNWLKGKDNPYFARAFVNRVWANYFSRGIVEPADDMNLANPPVNKELMDYLAAGFVAHGYDMKWVHREILNSDTYQRSWKPNVTNYLDEKNFSRMVMRRLPAEIVLDGVTQATTAGSGLKPFASALDERAIGPIANAGNSGNGNNKGFRGGDSYTLTIFGRPPREANCDCERTTDPTLLQTIYTRNDPTLLARLETAKRDQPAWIDELRESYEKADRSRDVEKLRQKLKEFEAKAAAMKPPTKPAGNDPEALAMFKEDMKRHTTQAEDNKKRKAEMEAQLAAAQRPRKPFVAEQAIREVFLRTVSRPPTMQEFEQAKADVAAAKNPVDGVRDLLWAMLNTREFMVNH